MMRRPLSGPAGGRRSAMASRISAGSAMRPGPNSPQAMSPSFGPTTAMPSARNVARLRCSGRVQPHAHVHGGRDQHGLVRRHAAASRRGRRPGRSPSWPSARRWRAPRPRRSAARLSSIWPISASSVRLKRSLIDLLAGERGERQRRDELGAGPGQHGRDAGAGLAQQAHELEAFVSRDAAADDQEDALALHDPAPPAVQPEARTCGVDRAPARLQGWIFTRPAEPTIAIASQFLGRRNW